MATFKDGQQIPEEVFQAVDFLLLVRQVVSTQTEIKLSWMEVMVKVCDYGITAEELEQHQEWLNFEEAYGKRGWNCVSHNPEIGAPFFPPYYEFSKKESY